MDTAQTEKQIESQRRDISYDTREFTVEYIADKYRKEEFYVPEYQRDFVWSEERQSKFIESIILGLPIPSMFFAENGDGKCEIVDGSQRVRTFAAYLNDDLVLEELQLLNSLNGLKFSQLDESRKRKIKNTAMRIIFLSDGTTEEVKNDLFERINRGSDLLRNMEKRKGIYRGDFTNFIYNECANNSKFRKLAPVPDWLAARQEHAELVLRFFALFDMYPNFKTERIGIAKVLDTYIYEKNLSFSDEEKRQKMDIFNSMLDLVEKKFPHGFSKKGNKMVSRVYFEALAVGTAQALKSGLVKDKNPIQVSSFISDESFSQNISGKYQTHTPQKIRGRIDFIKHLLVY